jgi:hypothetical protein
LENNLPYNLQTVEKSNHIQKENNVKSERKYSGRFDVKNFESEKIRREKRSSYSIGLDLDSQNDGNQNSNKKLEKLEETSKLIQIDRERERERIIFY